MMLATRHWYRVVGYCQQKNRGSAVDDEWIRLVRAIFATCLTGKWLARLFTPTDLFPREIARTPRVRTWIRLCVDPPNLPRRQAELLGGAHSQEGSSPKKPANKRSIFMPAS